MRYGARRMRCWGRNCRRGEPAAHPNFVITLCLFISAMHIIFSTRSWRISVGMEPSQRASDTGVWFPVKPNPPNRPLYRSHFTMDFGSCSTHLTPNLYLVSRLHTRGSTTPFPHTHLLLGASCVVSGSSRTLRSIDWYFRLFGTNRQSHFQGTSASKRKTFEDVKNVIQKRRKYPSTLRNIPEELRLHEATSF